jgi:hypothetical protein
LGAADQVLVKRPSMRMMMSTVVRLSATLVMYVRVLRLVNIIGISINRFWSFESKAARRKLAVAMVIHILILFYYTVFHILRPGRFFWTVDFISTLVVDKSTVTNPQMSTFDSRKQQSTGEKRGIATRFHDCERKKCSKLVIPDMQKLIGLVGSFKEQCDSNLDKYSMLHLQLKLSKEHVLIACRMLKFLDLVSDLEELACDTKKVTIPLIDTLISECQDQILDKTSDEKWEQDYTKTKKVLDETMERMNKVFNMVFRSKRSMETEERYDILHLCFSLFSVAEDLVKSCALDSELEQLLEEAGSKCDDQTLDEYLDVDCEEEEEEDE